MRWLKKILVWLAFVLLLFATLVVGTLLAWSEDTQLLVTGSAFFAGLVIFLYRRVQSWLPVVSLMLIWLILGLGLLLAWPETTQLVGIGLVVAAALAIWFYQRVQDRRSAARMEQALQEGGGAGDGRAEELDRFAQELEAAIKSLKKPGPEELEAPYHLPWFMMVGPPGAGKTTAIAHSGLDFTRQTAGTGEEKASSCDLVVCQEAVLVDTVGRYMSREEDSEEWSVLLDTLARHHRHKPINGVLLCLSLADLIDTEEGWDLEYNATKLRTRLAEMMRHLGVNFPIYLVFTKCDLLLGFEEFFQDLELHEKNQVWGCTVPREEREFSNPREVFTREFDRLVEVLADRRLARMGGEMEESDKARVYLFHLEFAAARDRLAGFVDELFWTHSYRERPIFRGFYFVSSIQEGSPTGFVLTSIIRQFDPEAPPPSLPPAAAPDEEGDPPGKRGFFIRDLLTEVVLPDRNMVVRTADTLWRDGLFQLGVTAAALAVLAAFWWPVSRAYDANLAHLRAVSEVVQVARTVELRSSRDFATDFAHLDNLRQRLAELEDPPLFDWGMYRGDRLRKAVQSLYAQKTDLLAERYIFPVVEKKLRAYLAKPASYEETYTYLKAYLLLGPERERLDKGLGDALLEAEGDGLQGGERRFLSDQLEVVLAEVYFQAQAPEEAEQLQQLAAPLVARLVDRLAREKSPDFSPDARLIADVRHRLYQVPTIPNIYARLKRVGAERLPAFTLNHILEGESAGVFRAAYEVPGSFTVEGWDTYMRQAIEQESKAPSQEDWVLGKDPARLPPQLRESDDLALALHMLYFEEYVLNWQRFIGGISYRPLGRDVAEMAVAVQGLGDLETSPLVELVDGLTQQTRFNVGWDEESEEEEEGVEGEGGGTDTKKTMKMITKYLKMFGIKPPKPPKIIKTVSKDVKKSMKGGKGSEQATAAAFEILRDTPQFYVDLQFEQLHTLSILPAPEEGEEGAAAQEQSGPPPAMVELLNQFATVGAALEGLVDDSGLKARDYAVGIFEQTAIELPQALAELSATPALPEAARKALLEEPMQQAWDAVLAATQVYMNARWTTQVYDNYRFLIGAGYPFNENGADVPIEDLAGFFAPQSGTLWSFVQDELKPLVDIVSWEAYRWQGRGVQVSPQIVHSLERAKQMAHNLFREGTLSVPFRLKPELPSAQGADGATLVVAQICLAIDGKEACYKMGPPQWIDYTWPSSAGVLGARLEVLTRETSVAEMKFEGPWGWFRLLQEAEIPTGQPPSLFILGWTLPWGGGRAQVNYLLQAPSANNPFAAFRDFFAFECPASLN